MTHIIALEEDLSTKYEIILILKKLGHFLESIYNQLVNSESGIHGNVQVL